MLIFIIIAAIIGSDVADQKKAKENPKQAQVGPCAGKGEVDCRAESACMWNDGGGKCNTNCGFYTGPYDNQKGCEAWACTWSFESVGGRCE